MFYSFDSCRPARLLLLLALAIAACPLPASATEFVRAHKIYLAAGAWYESGIDAAKAQSAKSCDASAIDCVAVFTDEIWDGNFWIWRGTHSYTSIWSGNRYSHGITGMIGYSCPNSGGWSAYQVSSNPGRCSRVEPPVVPCDICNAKTAPKVGNPISVLGGVKQQVDTDYSNASGTLRLTRTYRSDESRWLHNHQITGIDPQKADFKLVPPFACYYAIDSSTGKPWCFAYAGNGSGYSFGLRRGAGRLVNFGTSTDFTPPKDINDRADPIVDEVGERTGWRVSNASTGAMEVFSLTGHLQSSTARNGQVTTYTYSDATTLPAIAPWPGLLIKVEDAFGQALQFSYDSQGRMAGMTDPAGNPYLYDYDAQGNLIKVTYPGGKSRSYVYNELDKTGNVAQTGLLTGIIDENGVRYATFTYGADRKGESTEHAGGVGKYTLSYPSSMETSVLDPLNAAYYYTYPPQLGVFRRGAARRPGADGVGTVNSNITYDANGNMATYVDFDSAQTTYTYDLTRNLETRRVEASNNALARTISTEWHATFNLPLRIAEPLSRTTFTYDATGNVLTRTVQATTDANGAAGFTATLTGTARTWTYTYSALGQLLTARGPRTDVSDTTSYAYDENGNLSTVTNAAGHVTTLSQYDAHGRAGRVTDPNGLVTDFVYSPRGWLESTSVGGETTIYSYDGAGLMTGVALPDGGTLTYVYDAAHRLTSITDDAGNSVTYTLDNMGNRTGEQLRDSGGTLARQVGRVYDPLNRLKQITGAQQ